MNTLLRDSWVPALRTHVKGVVQLTLFKFSRFQVNSWLPVRFASMLQKWHYTNRLSLRIRMTGNNSRFTSPSPSCSTAHIVWSVSVCIMLRYTYAHITLPRPYPSWKITTPRPYVRPHNFTTPIMKDYYAPYAHIILARPVYAFLTNLFQF